MGGYSQGWGLLKVRSLISPEPKFSSMQICLLDPINHIHILTGVTAAELRRPLSNINVIFDI